MKVVELSGFLRDIKHLSKKYPSLSRDFEELKIVLLQYPRGRGEKHWNRIYESDIVAIYKTRLVCASLRSDSLRLIYSYLPTEERIDFIEIYFKGDKENEDRKRIKDYLKS